MRAYPPTREESLNQIIDHGSASALEMIAKGFGGRIPAEIDLVNPPEYKISIRMITPGYLWSHMWSKVRMHWGGEYWPSTAATIFAGAAALDALSLRGYVDYRDGGHTININGFWALSRHFDRASSKPADTLGHESAHVLELHDDRISLSSALQDRRTPLKTMVEDCDAFVQYVGHESEMQARLYTVLCNAYVQQGKLPVSKYELWAVLASQDIAPPPAFLAQIAHDPMAAEAFAKFPRMPGNDRKDKTSIRHLNMVQNNLSEGERFTLWNSVYPFLYGDLLEIMGDRLGHKRMGRKHNIQLREIFMRTAQDSLDGKIANDEAMMRMTDIAAKMPPEDALYLMRRIAGGAIYKEYNDASIFIPMGALRAAAVYALGRHPELKPQKAAESLRRVTRLAPRDWFQRQLEAQRMCDAREDAAADVSPETRLIIYQAQAAEMRAGMPAGLQHIG